MIVRKAKKNAVPIIMSLFLLFGTLTVSATDNEITVSSAQNATVTDEKNQNRQFGEKESGIMDAGENERLDESESDENKTAENGAITREPRENEMHDDRFPFAEGEYAQPDARENFDVNNREQTDENRRESMPQSPDSFNGRGDGMNGFGGDMPNVGQDRQPTEIAEAVGFGDLLKNNFTAITSIILLIAAFAFVALYKRRKY